MKEEPIYLHQSPQLNNEIPTEAIDKSRKRESKELDKVLEEQEGRLAKDCVGKVGDDGDPLLPSKCDPLRLIMKKYATSYMFAIFSHVIICQGEKEDLKGKRFRKIALGYPGFCCKYCHGMSARNIQNLSDTGEEGKYRAGKGGKYFPASMKTLSDSTKILFALGNHFDKCQLTPQDVKNNLASLKDSHTLEKGKKKRGDYMRFMEQIWLRLHGNLPYDP